MTDVEDLADDAAALVVHDRPVHRTVLVVDDHRSFAEMLAEALDRVAGLRSLGVATSAEEAIVLAQRLRPGLVVMDIKLVGTDGLVATQRIREVAPDTVVAVLTAYTSAEWIGRAAQAGASAFLSKNGSLDEMIALLTTVQQGQLLVAASSLASDAASETTRTGASRPSRELSRREVDVLRLLADGTSVKDIAPALGITLNTCRGHVKSIRRKLDAGSQLEAVLKARGLDLLAEGGR